MRYKAFEDVETVGLESLVDAPAVLSMVIPSEPRSVAVIRHALALSLERTGVRNEDAEAIQMAVGEACANAVRHGSPDGGLSRMGVALYFKDSTATIIVKDQGTGFDPELIPDPKFEALPEGGMGIYLMRRVMDKVEFRAGPEGTWVILSRILDKLSS